MLRQLLVAGAALAAWCGVGSAVAVAQAPGQIAVRFVNQTNVPVQISWLNNGQENPVVTLGPGQTAQGNSTIGHAFMARNAANQAVINRLTVAAAGDLFVRPDVVNTPPPGTGLGVGGAIDPTGRWAFHPQFIAQFDPSAPGMKLVSMQRTPGGIEFTNADGNKLAFSPVAGEQNFYLYQANVSLRFTSPTMATLSFNQQAATLRRLTIEAAGPPGQIPPLQGGFPNQQFPQGPPANAYSADPADFAGGAAAAQPVYYLGRRPDPNRQVYVFDVMLPADVAGVLTVTGQGLDAYRERVRQSSWESGGQSYQVYSLDAVFFPGTLDYGQIAIPNKRSLALTDYKQVNAQDPGFAAVKEQLRAQATMENGFGWVTTHVLKGTATTGRGVTLDFAQNRPYSIVANGPTKRPQMVAVNHNGALHVAFHVWNSAGPTNQIVVGQADLANRQFRTIRAVPSPGTLVGFAMDGGVDYVLAARLEEFENRPQGDFLQAVHGQRRQGVMMLYGAGQAADLNSEKFTDTTFYGITNAGTGRLAAGNNLLAASFSRRFYANDGLIHQEGNDMVVEKNLASVPMKANNRASHSFDQRLIFDGQSFVALHQCDTFPYAGLIVEKFTQGQPGQPVQAARFNAFACPSASTSVYFELGGLAAERDGYPILFTATRNTQSIPAAQEHQFKQRAWDLGMVYAVRDFEQRQEGQNPYDTVAAGILANGYAQDEQFQANITTWDFQTSSFTKLEPRNYRRRVAWLTQLPPNLKATNAKLCQLGDGQYVAIWEEHVLDPALGPYDPWRYSTTRALRIQIAGGNGFKTIQGGQAVELPRLRLHQGDDAVTVALNGAPHAAWVTAGTTIRELTVHTLDASLVYRPFPLTIAP